MPKKDFYSLLNNDWGQTVINNKVVYKHNNFMPNIPQPRPIYSGGCDNSFLPLLVIAVIIMFMIF